MTTVELESKKTKKANPVGRFFYFIFIKNWGLKLIAIVSAAALWFISVGL